MTDIHEKLQADTTDAIRKAFADIKATFGADPIRGFALCTDSDLMTLYSAVCTESWLAERRSAYEQIESIYTEWSQFAGDEYFGPISEQLAELFESEESTAEQRYEALVAALEDCRHEGFIDSSTKLLCGDTDGIDETEIRAVFRLNSQQVANQIAKDLGFSDFEYESADELGSTEPSIVQGRKLIQLSPMEIVPGRGINGCEIGSTSDSVQEVLGNPDEADKSYFSYHELGIEVAFTRGIVDALFFFFRVADFKSFKGATPEGIGATSSVDDVKRQYGEPDKHDSTPTSTGGLAESFYYDRLGVTFSYRDGELEDIRIH